MRTPAQRKASAAYAARRKERGDKLVRVWVPQEYVRQWENVCGYYDGSEMALRCLIDYYPQAIKNRIRV